MHIERLTPTALLILEALGTFRFLTSKHMMRLGITKAKRHLYTTLRTLTDRNPSLVVEFEFGALPTKGRLARIYTLTKHGAELLQEALRSDEPIDVAKRARLFPHDYFHRLACVDFHITLHAWARENGVTIDDWRSYYDPWQEKAGKRAVPRTHVPLKEGSIVPDALFLFTTPDGTSRLVAFEMCCGRRTGYVEKKLETYIRALDAEAIEQAFGYPHEARVLLVFDRGDTAARTLLESRMATHPSSSEFAHAFYMKTLDEVEHSFVDGWHRLSGEVTPLFQGSLETAVA